MFFVFFDFVFFIVVVVVVTHEIPLFWLPNCYQGWLLHVLLLHYHCSLLLTFFIVFSIDHNATLGSHTDGLMGSLQPSIHTHLSAATNIVVKAIVAGTAERNNLSYVVTGNLQCYTSRQGSMVPPYQKQAVVLPKPIGEVKPCNHQPILKRAILGMFLCSYIPAYSKVCMHSRCSILVHMRK